MGSVGMAPRTGVSTKQWLVDELWGGDDSKILAHATSKESGSNVWWAAALDSDGTAYAVCVIYRRTSSEWWYKDMDESVGPCYYKVPAKVRAALEQYPRQREAYAAEWWQKVSATPAPCPKRRPKVGEVIVLDAYQHTGFTRFQATDRPSVFIALDDLNVPHGRCKLYGWTTVNYIIEGEQ